MFNEDKNRSAELVKILKENGFLDSEIGIAIIEITEQPKIFGYNFDHFIYPASIYKVFIATEVLRRVEIGDFDINQIIQIKSPNDVDKDQRIFPGDKRNLLKVGDKVTIDLLLDLMLTRSDNTASNTLIDLVGRESITKNIIYAHNWHGSEVTRKFLDRIKEDKDYQFSSTTLSCARHLSEFFYLVEKEKLVSVFVSKKLKEYMLRWNREGRGGLFIPQYISYYRKGGFLETNFYKYYYENIKKCRFLPWSILTNIAKLIRHIWNKKYGYINWEGDAGVFENSSGKYAVVVLSVNKFINPYKRFRMKELAKLIYGFVEEQKQITKTLPREAWQKVIIKENNEPLIEIKETKRIKIGQLNSNYQSLSFVRKTISEKLIKISENLPDGINLVLIEGYRTMQSQQDSWDRKFAKLRQENPNLSDEEIEKQVRLVLAKPSPLANHHCGGAVDVTLAYSDGALLDMGTPYPGEAMGSEWHNKFKMFSDQITEKQKINRKILRDVMEAEGFVWYPAEWWHYCYGDRMWAVYSNREECIYGPVYLQPHL